jgi:lipopolysaccharide transport system permease protein
MMLERPLELADDIAASAHAEPKLSALPREPVIKIRPQKKSLTEDFKEIWAQRELFLVFVWRDLKMRYKQSVLGIGWVILHPLLMTLVFTLFFGIVVRVPSDGIPYPVFAYSGLLAWMFFSQAIAAGTQSLSTHGHLINYIYFPRLMLPLVNVCVRLVDVFVASIVLVALMFSYGMGLSWRALLFPVLILQLAVLAFGLSAFLARLHLKYRDVSSLLPVILQVWMFASPTVYPPSLIGPNWRKIYFLNPIAGVIENLRAALFGSPFDLSALLVSIVITIVLTLVSLWAFYAMSKDLADVF